MKFFRNLYLFFFKWWTFLLLGQATKCVHKLMLGKNPNYVSTPASPPVFKPVEVDDSKASWMVDTKIRPTQWLGVPISSPFVNDPKAHPVLKSREMFAAKQAAAKKAKENKQEVQASEYTEVGSGSIDHFNSTISEIEKTLKDQN